MSFMGKFNKAGKPNLGQILTAKVHKVKQKIDQKRSIFGFCIHPKGIPEKRPKKRRQISQLF